MLDQNWESRYEEFKKAVAQQVLHVRKRRGLSLRGLAKKCDISHRALWSVEKAKTDPRLSTLFVISEALNTTVAEFMVQQPGADEAGGRMLTFAMRGDAVMRFQDEISDVVHEWAERVLTERGIVNELVEGLAGTMVGELLTLLGPEKGQTVEPEKGDDHGR